MIKKAAEMTTEAREKMRGGTGAVAIQHYFTKEEFAAKVRLCARLILPPGAGIGTHRHDGEDEVYIVLRGSGELEDGGTHQRVSAGDAVLTGNGAAHAIRNDGDEDLELVAMIMCYGGDGAPR